MECKCSIGIHKLYVSVTSSPPRAGQSCFRGFVERSCRSDSLGPCTCPWLRISPSFRLLRAITKSCVSTTFRGVYANVRRRLCPRQSRAKMYLRLFLSFGRWGLGTRLGGSSPESNLDPSWGRPGPLLLPPYQ